MMQQSLRASEVIRYSFIAIAFPALLCSCAISRDDVLDSGIRMETTSTQTPKGAADCMRENVASYKSRYVADQSPIKDFDGQEIVVHVKDSKSPSMIVRLTPIGGGSRVSMRFSPLMLSGRDELVKHMLAGC